LLKVFLNKKSKSFFKNFLCKGPVFEKIILRVFNQTDKGIVLKGNNIPVRQKADEAQKIREKIAKRASLEIESGMYVNLGIGFCLTIYNFLNIY